MLMSNSVKILCLTAYLVLCADAKTRTTFIKIPKTLDLAGLKCARDHYTTDRAVRYNLLTGDCETLDDAWFSDQIIEKNFNYYKLSMVENIFKPSMTVKENIPEILVDGISIIMSVELLDDVNDMQFRIGFGTRDGSEIGFHVTPQSDKDRTVFDNYSNRTWVKQRYGPYLFQRSSWRMYELEFKISPTSISTYVDGQLLNEFNHRTSVSNYQIVNFLSSKAICSRIQFLYPQ